MKNELDYCQEIHTYQSNNEIWKNIDGYNGYYQISKFGKVKNKNGKVLKFGNDKDGYKVVNLYKNKKHKLVKTHRLVAQAFIPNPNNYPCVNHKDENKLNNCVDNLEWCTIKYNNTYNNRHKKISEKHKKAVVQYDRNMNFIAEYSSIQEASEKTGIRHISGVCLQRNGRKTAGGYIWKYKEE